MLSVLCSSDGESTVLRFITVNKTSLPQFRVFFRNIVENIKFSFRLYRTSDADDAEHIFWSHYRQIQLICYQSYALSRCFTPNRWALSFPVTWLRWRSNHSIRHCRKTPCYTQTLRLYRLQNQSYCQLIFFALWE